MIASLSAEFLKLRHRPAVWLVAGGWLALTVVFGYVLPYLAYRGTDAGPEAAGRSLSGALPAELVSTAIQGFPLFAGALALLLGVLATGSEYGWYTVKTVLTQGPRRWEVLAGKLAAWLLVVLAIVLATFAVAAAASSVVAAAEERTFAWPSAGEVAGGVAAGWLVVGTWCLAGAFLGVLVRSTALAVGVGLVWTLAVENLLRIFAGLVDALDTAQHYLPGTNAGALVAALGSPEQGEAGGTPGVTSVVSGTHAGVVLAVYAVVFTVAMGILLHRRDVT